MNIDKVCDMIKISLPLNENSIKKLKAGDRVLLSGKIITGRDAAHKRLYECLIKGEKPPVDILNQTIYYVGACPPGPGKTCGSCGPTTSMRMDKFTPLLIERGLRGMIGKGDRNKEVYDAITKYGAVYFAAIGGAGALYAGCVTGLKTLAYPDLLTEAVLEMTIKDFPVIVAIDSLGNSIY